MKDHRAEVVKAHTVEGAIIKYKEIKEQFVENLGVWLAQAKEMVVISDFTWPVLHNDGTYTVEIKPYFSLTPLWNLMFSNGEE